MFWKNKEINKIKEENIKLKDAIHLILNNKVDPVFTVYGYHTDKVYKLNIIDEKEVKTIVIER